MNDSDNKIDILISRHLGKQLDRHVGRAQRAFLAEVSQRRRWYIPRYWAAAAGLFFAATLAGVFSPEKFFFTPTPPLPPPIPRNQTPFPTPPNPSPPKNPPPPPHHNGA